MNSIYLSIKRKVFCLVTIYQKVCFYVWKEKRLSKHITKHGLGFSNLFVSEVKAAQSGTGLNFPLVESCSRMLLYMARILDRIHLLRLEDRPWLRGGCCVLLNKQFSLSSLYPLYAMNILWYLFCIWRPFVLGCLCLTQSTFYFGWGLILWYFLSF